MDYRLVLSVVLAWAFLRDVIAWVTLTCSHRKKIILIFIWHLVSLQKRSYSVRFRNVSATTDPVYFETNCTVNSDGTVTYYGYFKIPIRLLYLQFIVTRVNEKGVIDADFANRTISICNYNRTDDKDVVTTRIYNVFMSFGLLPRDCPVKVVSNRLLQVQVHQSIFLE